MLCGMKKLLVLSLLLSSSLITLCQSLGSTIDESLFKAERLEQPTVQFSKSFFAENRDRLRDAMPDSSMVVLFSAAQKTKSNDIDYPFHQDPNF